MKAKLIHLGEIVNFFLLCCLLFFGEIHVIFFTLKYSSLDNNGLLKNKEVKGKREEKRVRNGNLLHFLLFYYFVLEKERELKLAHFFTIANLVHTNLF